MVVVAGILIYAATKPDSFRVQRSVSIKAPPEKIFALIDDLHGWAGWSPYEKKDPAMKRTFSGAPAARAPSTNGTATRTSARAAWRSSRPPRRRKVVIKLDFLKPFEGAQHRRVHPGAEGRHDDCHLGDVRSEPFIIKVMGLFMNMDKMIGKDFAAGLANLKAVAEKQ